MGLPGAEGGAGTVASTTPSVTKFDFIDPHLIIPMRDFLSNAIYPAPIGPQSSCGGGGGGGGGSTVTYDGHPGSAGNTGNQIS